MSHLIRIAVAAVAALGLTFGAVATGMYHHSAKTHHAVAGPDMHFHG